MSHLECLNCFSGCPRELNILYTLFMNPLRFTDRQTGTFRFRNFYDEGILLREHFRG